MDMKNSSIEKVLQTIEEKSDFYFLYSNRLIDVDIIVSVQVDNVAISSILENIFSSTNVDYEVKGKQIVLSPKVEVSNATELTETKQTNKKTITGTIVDSGVRQLLVQILLKKAPTMVLLQFRW